MFIRKKKILKWLKEYEKANQWYIDKFKENGNDEKLSRCEGFDDALSATIVKIEQKRNRWSFDPIKFNKM